MTFITALLSLSLLVSTPAPCDAQAQRLNHRPSNNTFTWQTLNNPKIHHTGPSSFTIITPPATDIWRPNVTADNFTASYLFTTCKASDFKSISVTVSGNWKTRYDQGGIAVFFPNRHHGNPRYETEPMKWVKTGIELENDAPQFGTVRTYAFSDWSLSPVRPAGSQKGTYVAERSTTEMWMYAVVGGQRYPLREVTWALLEKRGKKDAEDLGWRVCCQANVCRW